jgi:hypothetical protein
MLLWALKSAGLKQNSLQGVECCTHFRASSILMLQAATQMRSLRAVVIFNAAKTLEIISQCQFFAVD